MEHAMTEPQTSALRQPDTIALHMEAVNSLARCKACLTANEPMYLFAQQQLKAAQQAVAALWAIESNKSHH